MTTTADAHSPRPRIRPARPGDLLHVHQLERRCFPQPWPFEAFGRHLDAPAFLVAEVDGHIVGYVVGDRAPGFPGPVGHIKDVAVHPEYRRQGIARDLLSSALQRLAEDGVVRTNLEVRAGNEAAISLYRSLGFTPWRTREGYYPDGEAALVMTHQFD